MLNLKEYRENPNRLSDLLPWAALVAPEVVLNKDSSFQSTIRFRGPDLESATEEELMAVSARLNNVLKRLGSGWAIYVEAQRSSAAEYPQSVFDEPVSFLIDAERREMFENSPHFESHHYLTLIYLPPPDPYQKLTATFLEGVKSGGVNYEKILEGYRTELTRFVQLMEHLFPEVELLEGERVLTYLHSLISEKKHPVTVPEVPMYLDAFLSDTPLIPGLEPQLGALHLQIVAIISFPGKSYPGLFDQLNRLGIEYRWVTRFICMDKNEADSELQKYKEKWFAKRKGIVTLLKEVMTNAESVMTDTDAINKAQDADEAIQELNADAVSYGYFTAAVVVAERDQSSAQESALAIERVINGLGFTTKIESVNAVDAWLGTIPGNTRSNVRRPLLHTLNLA